MPPQAAQTDHCNGSGVCLGSNPVTCAAPDQCHDAGTCNSGTGLCSNPQKSNGTACNDGSACTSGDVCTAGVCGGATVACNDNNSCTNDSCNPSSGCVNTPIPNCTPPPSCGDGGCNGLETCDPSDTQNYCQPDCGSCTGCTLQQECTPGGINELQTNFGCSSCVTQILAKDPSCGGLWDATCVAEVSTICRLTCDPNTVAQNATMDSVCSGGDGQAACAAGCGDGSVFNGRCYAAFTGDITWEDSEAACASWGAASGVSGHLTSIASQEENDFVKNVRNANRDCDPAWIGLNDLPPNYESAGLTDANGNPLDGPFQWSDGTTYDFSHWNGGEPSNGGACGSPEDVVVMYGDGGWNDVCDVSAAFDRNQYEAFSGKCRICKHTCDTGAGGSGAPASNGTCAHSVNVQGIPLDPNCDPRVAAACKTDAHCCNDVWDAGCISDIQDVCKLYTPRPPSPGYAYAFVSTVFTGDADNIYHIPDTYNPYSVFSQQLTSYTDPNGHINHPSFNLELAYPDFPANELINAFADYEIGYSYTLNAGIPIPTYVIDQMTQLHDLVPLLDGDGSIINPVLQAKDGILPLTAEWVPAFVHMLAGNPQSGSHPLLSVSEGGCDNPNSCYSYPRLILGDVTEYTDGGNHKFDYTVRQNLTNNGAQYVVLASNPNGTRDFYGFDTDMVSALTTGGATRVVYFSMSDSDSALSDALRNKKLIHFEIRLPSDPVNPLSSLNPDPDEHSYGNTFWTATLVKKTIGDQPTGQPIEGTEPAFFRPATNPLAPAPSVAPSLAYVSQVGSQDQIFVCGADNPAYCRDPKQLTFTGHNKSPRWTPDGKYLFFVSDRSGMDQIYIMKNDGTEQRQLTNLSAGARDPVVFRDPFTPNRCQDGIDNDMNGFTDGADPACDPSQPTALTVGAKNWLDYCADYYTALQTLLIPSQTPGDGGSLTGENDTCNIPSPCPHLIRNGGIGYCRYVGDSLAATTGPRPKQPVETLFYECLKGYISNAVPEGSTCKNPGLEPLYATDTPEWRSVESIQQLELVNGLVTPNGVFEFTNPERDIACTDATVDQAVRNGPPYGILTQYSNDCEAAAQALRNKIVIDPGRLAN